MEETTQEESGSYEDDFFDCDYSQCQDEDLIKVRFCDI